MNYRKFGKTGIEVSALGFGTMRLPMQGEEVNEKESLKIVRHAIDEGVNYIDTAYAYLDGKSEEITGRILADGYRDKVYLATKSPVWLIEKADDFDKYLDEQLRRLQTDRIDFYLLHSLKKSFWEDKVLKFDLVRKMEDAKKSGKIGQVGFSFHDNLKLLKEIIDYHDSWDFCQLQLNYVDTHYQGGLEGMRYASERGLGVIAMEPLRGGYLVDVPDKAKAVFEKSGKTNVEWALDFLWDMPEISLLLSGMGAMQQVKENIEYASRSSVGMFESADHEIIKKVQEVFKEYDHVPCTDCKYCMPCPQAVAIPDNFTIYNEFISKYNLAASKEAYRTLDPELGEKAEACISCGICEDICPQQIKISEIMPKIADLLR